MGGWVAIWYLSSEEYNNGEGRTEDNQDQKQIRENLLYGGCEVERARRRYVRTSVSE